MSHGDCEILDLCLLANANSAAPPVFAEEAEVPGCCDTFGVDIFDVEEQNGLYCIMAHLLQQFLKKRRAECVRRHFIRRDEEAFSRLPSIYGHTSQSW